MDRLKLMETFTAVVEAGSLTRAAERLALTSAMVSKRLQTLESELGVRLLNRNTHGFRITESGAEYFEECVRLLGEIKRLDDSMQQRRRAARGDVRVLSTRTFSETTLAPIVADFCARYPDISLRMTLMDRTMAPRGTDLISGGFDIAIRSLSPTDSTLIARPLIELDQVLVASPAYLKRNGEPRTPDDLSKHNCLAPDAAGNSRLWELVGPDCPVNVRVDGAPRTNGTLIVREAALKGLGIAFLRLDLVQDHIRADRLRIIMRNYPPRPKKFFAIYPKAQHQPQRVRVFTDFLIRELKKAQKKREPRARESASS